MIACIPDWREADVGKGSAIIYVSVRKKTTCVLPAVSNSMLVIAFRITTASADICTAIAT